MSLTFLSPVYTAVLMCDVIRILSILLSCSGIVSKQLNISTYFLHRVVAPSF